MRNTLALIAIAILITSCVESGGSGSNSTSLPDVQVQCNVSTCQTSGTAEVYVGLIEGTDVDCQNLLLTLTSVNTFGLNFDAWGTGSIVLDGGFQRAFITQWFDANDATIQRLADGSYTICGFYDTDASQTLDLNEGYAEATTTLDINGTYIFIDWVPN